MRQLQSYHEVTPGLVDEEEILTRHKIQIAAGATETKETHFQGVDTVSLVIQSVHEMHLERLARSMGEIGWRDGALRTH